MKNFLTSKVSFVIAVASLLLLTLILRFNLYQTTKQFADDFKSQNFNEIYSMDTLKISSRLNAISSTVNWECIEAEIAGKPFFKMNKNSCSTGLFRQKTVISIPEANNVKITFTLKYSDENKTIYLVFLISQILLIVSLIYTTRKNEQEKKQLIQKAAFQLSHDIRSPLATLNSISENLQAKSNDDLKLLKLSIDRINQISNSLLDQGKEQRSINFNFNQTIANLVELKKIEHQHASITFSDKTNSEISITGNKIEFERMLSNLINNAIESNANPTVIITLEIENSDLKLSILDNGNGIPQTIIDNLGKSNLSTKEKGNGLGLSHAIETAQNANAKIDFLSKPTGTKITITYSSFEQKNLKSLTSSILVDDDQLVQLTWKARAAKSDVDLIIFSSAEELKNNLDNLNKDSTFYIDRELGGTNGEDLAIFLNQKGFQNIFLATGHSPDLFTHLTFLKGIIGKKPPF